MSQRSKQNRKVNHRSQALLATAVAGIALTLGGCATQYRPVVSAINPVGPAAQPTKYAFAVSNPGTSSNGLLTVVDFSGDTVLATPSILQNPTYFAVLSGGAQGFAINAQNGLSSIPLGAPSSLISSQVIQTTLPTNSNAPTVSAFTFGSASRILVPETAPRNAVAILSATSPALEQEISVGANPVYVVGVDSTARAYVISNGSGTGAGQVAAIEASSLSVSNTITVGSNPVYGVETSDGRRAFILNKGSGTVSVINVTNNALDSAHPTIPATGTLGTNPVWADLVAATNQLVVLNAGSGTTPGTLSIVNIPLCNTVTQPTNSTCDTNNPTDAANFGQVLATVPVGINPAMVSVLSDGSRAYVVNRGYLPGENGSYPNGVAGSVTVVNLVSGTVTATIPAAADPSDTVSTPATSVYGHPSTVAATSGNPTGKVYVTSTDSRYLTVLETDTDTVDTHINLQGTGVRVLVSTP